MRKFLAICSGILFVPLLGLCVDTFLVDMRPRRMLRNVEVLSLDIGVGCGRFNSDCKNVYVAGPDGVDYVARFPTPLIDRVGVLKGHKVDLVLSYDPLLYGFGDFYKGYSIRRN